MMQCHRLSCLRIKSSLRKKGIFQILGQGAIAATVALAVLFTADLVMVSDTPSAAANISTELAGSRDTSKFAARTHRRA